MKKPSPHFKMLPIAFGIAAMAMTSNPLWAADSAPAAAQGFQIEEVIITAKKVEESQQTVPISVAAFSAKALEQNVILTVSDLGEHVTGLVVAANSQGGAPTFAIRGTKTDNGVDGGVAVYLDDMPLISTNGVINSFYDMASVEILKGPQGTLFGVNTTGGVISFRANKPTDKFEGYADIGVGNYNRQEFEGMINIPVNDVLQIRMAGQTTRRDGFIKNLVPGGTGQSRMSDDKHESFRFSARLKPTTSITNDIVADYYHEDDAPRQAIPSAFTGLSTLGPSRIYDWKTVSLGGNPSGTDLPLFNKQKIWGVQDILNWEVNDNVAIKNVLGYRNDDNDSFEDNDGTYLDLVNGRTRHQNTALVNDFTLRLTTDDKRLRYTGGVYLSHVTRHDGIAYRTSQNYGVLGFLGPLFGAYTPGVTGPVVQNSANYYERDLRSHAIYSQVAYDLSKELTVELGLRYNWDSGKFSARQGTANIVPQRGGAFTLSPQVPCNSATSTAMPSYDPATCTGRDSGKWKAPSYTFVISDKFAEKSMIWFKASGGYLAGGFNNQILEKQYQQFLPEKTNEFEAGLKSDWEIWDRPIRTNIQAFYGNSKNKQEVENGGYASGTQWIAVFNAGAMTYYGTDMEVKFFPTDNLELDGSWTHVDSSYDNFQFPTVGLVPAADLSGATPAQIPRDTYNWGVTYKWPLASSAGKISSTWTSYYRDKTKFHDVANLGTFGANADSAPAYWTSSFNTSWNGIMGSNFDASIWVKNFFDKKYIVYKSAQTALGYAAINYGDPRTLGAHLRYNF